MAAAQVDSDREQVLWALIRIHTQQTNGNEGARSNPHEDDEKALQYCTKLESLYPDDRHSLYVASRCYSALGLYDKAIRILKRALSKISALKQSNNPALDGSADFADDIKKRITKTLIRRYHNCPNDSHETIIRYLIELIEWKYNGFQAATLQAYIEEIWKRIEYILNKHMDSVTVNKQNKDLHKMESEWNTICKLLCSIPCSIPLSAHLMNYILDVFMKNNEYKCGVEFFTRLIAEYQTFDGNGLSIHATFDKYDVLYLNRAKLYHVLGAKQKMLNNIEYCNRRLLRNARDMTKTELVNECNVAQYVIQDANEKPIIETSQQIKISEPVADRNQTNEVDTDEKEEEECKEHATTNDSENENKTDETLSQRKASPTLDVKAIDIHTKTPHPPSKVSQTMTHRDVSSEKSMVDTPDMDGKDGEESTEQSITNSDSEGETKTQETQDDENNKENRQSIKDSNKNKLKLDQLEKLGYNDRTKNLGLLKMYGGDVNLVIQDYTVQQDFKFKLQPAKQRESKPIMAEATLKTTAQRKTEAKPQAETKARKDIKKEEIASDICDSECEQEDDRLRARQLQSSDGDSSDSDSDSSSESDSDLSDSSNNSTEQSITNSDSEGETKTQETQDDEDNKDSKAETKQNDNNPNHRRKRDAAFHVEMFIYQVLRQVHPELEISKTAVRLLNSMAEDAFDRICCEAGRLCQYSNKDTLGAKEIQVATSLVVPCKLAKRAQSKAMVTPYMASEIFDCDSSESDSDSDSSVSIGSAHGVMDKLRNL
eukprot:3611_1